MGAVTSNEEITAVLRAGGVALIPTDTVYGIAALATLPAAVRTIFDLKRRPASKALPVLGATVAQLEEVGAFHDAARRLAARRWPGPLTMVLPRAPGFQHYLGGDGATVGVRVPASEDARRLLERTGPLAVTSANLSGHAPAVTAREAGAVFPHVPILDGGACGGEPSTTIAFEDGRLVVLREGALSLNELLRD